MLREDQPKASELFIYFTHFFMSVFKATAFLLETETTTSCDLYEIMKKFRYSHQSNISDDLFWHEGQIGVAKAISFCYCYWKV